MKSYSIQAIERQISEDFVSVYKTSANFPDTVLYNKCMKIICNSDDLRCIISANDAGIPPVKSLLSMLGDRGLLKVHAWEVLWHFYSSRYFIIKIKKMIFR